MKGLLITFEGIEGSGKSTQLRRLAAYLIARDYLLITTREPGGTSVSEQIRQVLLSVKNGDLDPRCELFLYLASRTQHVEEVILPALREGKIVLCDRFSDATLAYQGFGRGLSGPFLKQAVSYAAKGLRPDLTLLFDLDVKKGLSRVHGRGFANRLDREDIRFHQRVRQGYLKLARTEPRRIKVIKAGPEINAVTRAVQKIVSGFLKRYEGRFSPSLPVPALPAGRRQAGGGRDLPAGQAGRMRSARRDGR